MRILLVTQMWPGPSDPDLGVFVFDIARELRRLGHEVQVSAIDRRGGSPVKYARLTGAAVVAARRFRPDVVFAHFLFPAGAAGAAAAGAARVPLVVMAHGTDVENARRSRVLARATRLVTNRAATVICNSRWLADRLGPVRGDVEIIDCGVDLEVFAPRPAGAARARVGWGGDGPAFLAVGSLIERKAVVELADAFEALGRGSLAFVGDGPLRSRLEGRPGVHLAGRVAARRGGRLDRGLRRALPAVAGRAVRPGGARGDGDGAQRGGDDARAARRSSSPRRPACSWRRGMRPR